MAAVHDSNNIIRQTSSFANEIVDLKANSTATNATPTNVNTKAGHVRNSWESCYYCPRENFKVVNEFVKLVSFSL